MKKNERLQALHILTKLLANKSPLTYLFQATPELTPFCQELCFGVCRYYVQLETIADQLLTKRPKDIEVWLCVLLGLYQLHYLKTPDYAVVKETVALLDKIKKAWAKSLVNAVLRNFCRKQETLLAVISQSPSFTFNHPAWFIKRLQTDWPDDWKSILQANDRHPPMNLRVNQKKIKPSAYLQQLADAGIQAAANPYTPEGIELNHPCPVFDLPSFADGYLSVQDAAAQLAVRLLDLKPGLRVLDACCAPGGKTGHILESQPCLDTLTALDVDSKRIQRVQENLNRLQLSANLIVEDALQPETWWDGVQFDRILLDAPCSALGIIRRHPDIKLLRTESELSKAAKIQRDLLHTLWPLLAPNGIMVYATCSIMKEENEEQMALFASTAMDCRVDTQKQAWGRSNGLGWQILPGDANMDGFFYCVLKKIPA